MKNPYLVRRAEQRMAQRVSAKKAAERQKKLAEAYERRLTQQRQYTKAWKLANPEKAAAQQARYRERQKVLRALRKAEIIQNSVLYAELPAALPPANNSAPSADPKMWAEFWKDKLKTPEMAPKPPDSVDNG